MSPTIAISVMSAATGVPKSGPMVRRFCRPKAVRRGVCGMATTSVGGVIAGAGLAFVVAAVAAIVVTVGVDVALVRVGAVPNSCRAAASIIHGSGDTAGAFGELPANG